MLLAKKLIVLAAGGLMLTGLAGWFSVHNNLFISLFLMGILALLMSTAIKSSPEQAVVVKGA